MSDILFDPNKPTAPQGYASAGAPAGTPALDLGPGAPASAPQTVQAGDVIKDSDTEHFMADVIEASKTVPVIVDFWSPQSKACTLMMPMLEKLTLRAGGFVKLVKINVDIPENQALAGQLQVQSVPTVFAFKDGRPVDAIAGAQSEAQTQIFIDKLIGDAKPPIEAAMEQAGALLVVGDGEQAEAIYTAVLSQDPTFVPALAGMIRAIAAQNDFDRATDIIDNLEARTRHHVEIEQAVSAFELAQQSAAADPAETAALKAKVAANPKDLAARFDLSLALFAQGDHEATIEQLLEIVRIDRAWNEEAGRKQLIKVFDTLGPTDPLTQDARRRMSAILFS